MAEDIPAGITAEHIERAAADFDAGRRHEFGDSTGYDLLVNGRRYPPKAILGIAAGYVTGRQLGPYDFRGGLDTRCFRVLENLKFEIVPKPLSSIEAAEQAREDMEKQSEAEIAASDDLAATEKEQLLKSRRGQGLFKTRVNKLEHSCRVTGVSEISHLRASHIKPWRWCSNPERLDGSNGLILTPDVDHLFDRGFISFADDGSLLMSPAMDLDTLSRLGIEPACVDAKPFTAEQREYLAYHRREVFLKIGG